MKLIKRLKGMKLKNRIVVMFIFLVMVPVFLIIQSLIMESGNKIIEQTTTITDYSVTQITSNIANMLESKIEVATKICYYDQVLKQALALKKEYSAVDNIDLYANYLNTYEFNILEDEIDLKIYYLEDSLIQNYTTFIYVDEDVEKLTDYTDAIKANGHLTWGCNHEKGYIYISGTMKDERDSIIAVVAVQIPLKKVNSLIDKSQSDEKMILIYDSDGNVIASNHSELRLNDKLFKYLSATGNKAGIYDYYDNGSYKVIYKSLYRGKNFPNWTLATIVPLDQILNDAENIRNRGILISAVILLISCGLFVFLINRITIRIQRFVKQMKKVEGGVFETVEANDRDDEIGIMTRGYNLMVISLEKLIYESYEKNLILKDLEVKKREAELYALQSQLHPHFLFNTLESIRMKLRNSSEDEAELMILNLSKLLRKSLNCNSEMVTLKEEMEFSKYYLEIQKLRFKDKLLYQIKIEDRLESVNIPKLIIQPIVENAVIHGIENIIGEGFIEISASAEGKELIIRIKDNGIGMSNELVKNIIQSTYLSSNTDKGNHIGIRNVHDRLVKYYGEGYGMQIESDIGKGSEVMLILPLG